MNRKSRRGPGRSACDCASPPSACACGSGRADGPRSSVFGGLAGTADAIPSACFAGTGVTGRRGDAAAFQPGSTVRASYEARGRADQRTAAGQAVTRGRISEVLSGRAATAQPLTDAGCNRSGCSAQDSAACIACAAPRSGGETYAAATSVAPGRDLPPSSIAASEFTAVRSTVWTGDDAPPIRSREWQR